MLALKLALRSVMRRGWGMVGIVVPSAILFMIITFLFATKTTVRELLTPGVASRSFRIGTSDAVRSWAEQSFSEGEAAKLSRIPGVSLAPASFMDCGVDEKEPHGVGCAMTNRFYVYIWQMNMSVPPEELERWDRTKDGVIVTQTMATKYGWHVGSHITLHPASDRRSSYDLVVTYIADKFINSTTAYFHSAYVAQRYPEHEMRYWVIWGLVDRAEHRQAIIDEMERQLAGGRSHVITPMEYTTQALLAESVLLRQAFEVAGVLAFFLVIFISVALIALSIDQRITELAAMRAIGFRRGTLAISVLYEGFFMLLAAALIGGIALWIPFHNTPLKFAALFHVRVHPPDVFATILCGIAIGILSAMTPAWRVFKLDLISSLR